MALLRLYDADTAASLKELLAESAQKYSSRPFIAQKSDGKYKKINYRTFKNDADALGTALLLRGYAGKHIMLIGENSYLWAVTYMAVICGVGVVIPVNRKTQPDEVAAIARQSETDIIIYSEKYADTVSALDKAKRDIELIPFGSLIDLIYSGRTEINNGDSRYLEASINPRETAAVLYTSGSSAGLKGIALSHRNICTSIAQFTKMVKISSDDVFMSVLPLHHSYECVCGFLAVMSRGGMIAYAQGLRHLSGNMREVKPTKMLAVPTIVETMYHRIWANIYSIGAEERVKDAIHVTNPLRLAGIDLKRRIFSDIHSCFGGRLGLIICGCSPICPETMHGMRDFGIRVIQAYTVGECAGLAAVNNDRKFNDASAGLQLPDCLLDIYNIQADGTGEVRVKGDNVMSGYYKQPLLTAEVVRGGWFYTGDIGYTDKKGFLHLTGRKKNVIIRYGGRHVFPEELEKSLTASPYIKEAVIVGIPNDEKRDYELVAVIYPNLDAVVSAFGVNYTAAALDGKITTLISELNAKLPEYKRIDGFTLRREEFEKTNSRRIKRAGITDEVILSGYKKLTAQN